jgi:hypothetical protein
VLTQDESYADPTGACEVTHASQGAFAELQSSNATGRLQAIVDRHTAETRVAGMMSNLLKREVETAGGMGLVSALVARRHAGDGTNLAQLAPRVGYAYRGSLDTLYSGADDLVYIRPNLCCPASSFEGCRAVDDKTACTSSERFLHGSDYWKFMIMHEMGHLIQNRMTGYLQASYLDDGVTGAPALCRCDHVTASNKVHCLQGLQGGMEAQLEGFGHFYAVRAFNRDNRATDGVFRYYKDFLDTGCLPGVATADCQAFGSYVSSPPPLPINAGKTEKWRNQYCTVGAVPPDALTSMGTELDWMRFYLAWNTVGTNKSSLDEIADVYIQACGGTLCDADKKITFEGTFNSDGTVETTSLSAAAQGRLGNGNPNDPKYRHVLIQGDRFGVTGSTSQ